MILPGKNRSLTSLGIENVDEAVLDSAFMAASKGQSTIK